MGNHKVVTHTVRQIRRTFKKTYKHLLMNHESNWFKIRYVCVGQICSYVSLEPQELWKYMSVSSQFWNGLQCWGGTRHCCLQIYLFFILVTLVSMAAPRPVILLWQPYQTWATLDRRWCYRPHPNVSIFKVIPFASHLFQNPEIHYILLISHEEQKSLKNL